FSYAVYLIVAKPPSSVVKHKPWMLVLRIVQTRRAAFARPNPKPPADVEIERSYEAFRQSVGFCKDLETSRRITHQAARVEPYPDVACFILTKGGRCGFRYSVR